jgi:excisionase family DNA binding protein
VSDDFDPLELLTLAEVSALCKRSRRALYDDIKAKRLHVVHLGRSARVPRAELERYLTAAGARLDPPNIHRLEGGKS